MKLTIQQQENKIGEQHSRIKRLEGLFELDRKLHANIFERMSVAIRQRHAAETAKEAAEEKAQYVTQKNQEMETRLKEMGAAQSDAEAYQNRLLEQLKKIQIESLQKGASIHTGWACAWQLNAALLQMTGTMFDF